MPLAPRTRLGHYEILAPLGAGGMGEVYRASDTQLGRDVALKVLPATFLRDPERMLRFQREAQVLASLEHSNIGHIYGIVDAGDSRGLVLALVEGPTLADRILAGPLPLDEVVAISKQIIEALEYAHDRSVVHRDLKPANIKINPEGVVKVLDFGLAKVLEDEPTESSLMNSPTLTVGHTRAGVILGTAAYMSPEQAVGRPVDRRSDIFVHPEKKKEPPPAPCRGLAWPATGRDAACRAVPLRRDRHQKQGRGRRETKRAPCGLDEPVCLCPECRLSKLLPLNCQPST